MMGAQEMGTIAIGHNFSHRLEWICQTKLYFWGQRRRGERVLCPSQKERKRNCAHKSRAQTHSIPFANSCAVVWTREEIGVQYAYGYHPILIHPNIDMCACNV